MAKTLTSKVCGGSFVKAVYALHKKCGLSTMGCKTDALDKLFAMANGYKGKASTFQTEFLVAVMNVIKSGITMKEVILFTFMKAFQGKNSHVQYRIGEDINNGLIDETTNIDDFVAKHCGLVSTVDVMGPSKVQMVRPSCTICGRDNHEAKDCRDEAAKARPFPGS